MAASAYIYVIIMLHIVFAWAFLIQRSDGDSRFAVLFATSWCIEALRAAVLLPELQQFVLRPIEWFAIADSLCPVGSWFLFAACASLAERRLPGWLGPAYLLISIPSVIALRYCFSPIAREWYGLPADRGDFYSVLVILTFLFVPITVGRITILAWLIRIWRQTRLGGALIAVVFAIPYAIVAIAVPVQYFFAYNPAWTELIWAFRVVGFSTGLVMLRLSQHQRDLRQRTTELETANRGLKEYIDERERLAERIRVQQNQLHHSDRLNTLGELVAGIAHELNQPLSAISMFSSACRINLSKKEPMDKEQAIDCLDQIGGAAIRAGTIIKRLRSLASNSKNEWKVVSLNQVVTAAEALMSADLLNRNVQIETILDESLAAIHADEIQLQQVLINLIKNACDALKDTPTGRITIKTFQSKECQHVSVTDNSPGIDLENPNDVFEAFFTTKDDGMGIGLAICRSIVESHGGKISCRCIQPQGGSGTTLQVSLPKPE